MVVIAVPTLSSAGWVRSPAEKADFLLSHFYESDKFQTYLYGKNVANLQWLIEQHGHNITKLCSEIRLTLEQYLGRYYEAVSIEVVSNDQTGTAGDTESNSVQLRVFCQVTENGKDSSFGRLMMQTNSKFQSVVKLNNLGKT